MLLVAVEQCRSQSVYRSSRLAMLRPDAGRASSSSSCLNVELLLVLLTLVDIVGEVRVLAALPPGAEDEIVVIEHLPGRRVHLQDFFWTGEEDAPSWLDPNQILTLYETHTVHHTATVYIPEDPRTKPKDDGRPPELPSQPIDCASCINPTPAGNGLDDPDIGILIGDDPGPRYWLLTVLKPGESVPNKIELRLARLYKAAFTRQQQRHLGLLPENYLLKNYPKRQIFTSNDSLILESSTETSNVLYTPKPGGMRRMSLMRMRPVRITKSKRTLPILEAEDFEDLALKPIAEPQDGMNETKRDSRLLRSDTDVGLVQVRMSNTSVLEGGATRLIYSVHLGGKPVPAETAAKDMALLSAQEVALELGTPVIIPSEPYLKESRPLALSSSRDAWLLVGAAAGSFLIVGLVMLSLLLLSKRKRAQSSVLPPPTRRHVIRKDHHGYRTGTTPGIDNTAYTPDTDGRTEPTKRTTPASLSRTPGSQDTIDIEARDISSAENEPERETRRTTPARPWDVREYADRVKKGGQRRAAQRGNAADRPQSSDSVDSIGPETRGTQLETLESLEKGFGAKMEEGTGSPHSYLSMPSCKEFPNMRTVEPLSKVLEPVVVKHLDMELDSPDMKIRGQDFVKGNGEYYFARAQSDTKDPGVLGPIVWDLKRKRAVEAGMGDQPASDPEVGRASNRGTVGRARKRFNELIEDSFHIFGNREPNKPSQQQQQQHQQSHQQRPGLERRATHEGFAVMVDGRGKSANVSAVTAPTVDETPRPRTSAPRDVPDPSIQETGHLGPQPRRAWGSRPLSAGPFHRPNLPEVEVNRVLADAQLRPEDPAVPLIAAIKKELHKFNYD